MASNHNRQREQRMVLTGLTANFENGQYVGLDIAKVQIIDRATGRPLFEEVLDQQAPAIEAGASVQSQTTDQYTVEFDTPEGKMEYVKNGNWSGVRKVNN